MAVAVGDYAIYLDEPGAAISPPLWTNLDPIAAQAIIYHLLTPEDNNVPEI